MALREPTVKERILLHLFEYLRHVDDYDAPFETTQNGISRAVGIRVAHVPQYVRPLLDGGKVAEATKHVRGRPRKSKVYFLTEAGRREAAAHRATLLGEPVPVKGRDGTVSEVPLAKLYQETRRGASLSDLLAELHSTGFIADTPPMPRAIGVVNATLDAPEVGRFYGRGTEIEAVLRAIDGASLVVVTGIAGMGKSTLGAKVCESLRGDRSMFWRQLRPWDTSIDLASRVAEFLRSMGRSALHGVLVGSELADLSRIEDALTSDLAGARPLFVFDDVQDASEDAQRFLAALHRALRSVRGAVALLLSRVTPGFYSRREVEVDRSVVEIRLPGLDLPSREALLADAGVEEAVRASLAEASGGSPLFLRLLAATASEGSGRSYATIATYIAEQIEPSLTEAERACLQVASMYEVPVPADGLLREVPVEARTIIALQRRGLLEAMGDRAVLHESLRDYFRGALSAERRRQLGSKVIPWLLDRASQSVKEGDRRGAVAFVANAVRIDDDRERRLQSQVRLGRLRIGVSDYAGALETYREALAGATDRELEIRIRHDLVVVLQEQGRLNEADREIDATLALLPEGPSATAAWLHYWRAWGACQRDDFTTAAKLVGLIEGWLPSLPVDPTLSGRLAELRGLFRIEDPVMVDAARAREDFVAAIRDFEAAGDIRCLSRAYISRGLANVELGRADEALADLERGADLAEKGGIVPTQLNGLRLKAWFLADCRGDTSGAEALYQETFRLAREMDLRLVLRRLYADFAVLYQRQGRYAEARESLDYYLGLTASADLYNPEPRVVHLGLMARLCVLDGDSMAAERYCREGSRISNSVGTDRAVYSVAWAEATIRASRGDTEAAADAFLLAYERAPPSHGGEARAEFLLDYGRFLASRGDRARAAETLGHAAEEAARTSRGPIEAAARHALHDLGE